MTVNLPRFHWLGNEIIGNLWKCNLPMDKYWNIETKPLWLFHSWHIRDMQKENAITPDFPDGQVTRSLRSLWCEPEKSERPRTPRSTNATSDHRYVPNWHLLTIFSHSILLIYFCWLFQKLFGVSFCDFQSNHIKSDTMGWYCSLFAVPWPSTRWLFQASRHGSLALLTDLWNKRYVYLPTRMNGWILW